MSSTVPLTQDIDSVAKTHELVPSEGLDFENNRKGPNRVQGGRWVRWTVASLMLLGLVWFMIISKESSEPVGLEPVATPRSINGTDLMVRAYKIPDPSESRLGQRSFSGTLQARYQSLLGFRVAGKIIHRGVEVGDRVKKGQILFRLDPTDYDLQLQVAQADLEAAKSQLVQIEAEEGRLADLRKTRSTSQSDYDLAVSLRDTARSRLQAAGNRETLAKNQRQYADLIADQDGLVTRLMAEVGQVISPGQPVGQWVHGTELEALVSVPESMQQALSQSKASVEFWSMPGVSVPCTLREISPIADPASRTYDAKFTLVDPPKVPRISDRMADCGRWEGPSRPGGDSQVWKPIRHGARESRTGRPDHQRGGSADRSAVQSTRLAGQPLIASCQSPTFSTPIARSCSKATCVGIFPDGP